jgi:hypothetical protein
VCGFITSARPFNAAEVHRISDFPPITGLQEKNLSERADQRVRRMAMKLPASEVVMDPFREILRVVNSAVRGR